MVPIQEFLPHVLPYVHGCSDPLAEQYIRDICIDFCSFSSLVQVALEPISLKAGQIEYEIDTPSETDVSLIVAASYMGAPLAVEKVSDSTFLGSDIPLGQPSGVLQAPSNIFTLNRRPQSDQADAIQMLIATKPTRTANTVADVLLDYAYEIGQGVVGRLMLVPGQDFYSPQTAGIYTNVYGNAKASARIRAERSFGAVGTRVRPRAFG